MSETINGVIPPSPTQNFELENVLTTSRPIPPAAEEETAIAKMSDSKWFETSHDQPVVAFRWMKTHWEGQVFEPTGRPLEPRMRRLLPQALRLTIRRYIQRFSFKHHLEIRQAQARRNAEIQNALNDSRAAGTIRE